MKILFAALVGATCLGLAACDVDQTQEGEMPDVDVSGGQAPEYDVEGPEVNVGTETRTVETPTIDVDPPE